MFVQVSLAKTITTTINPILPCFAYILALLQHGADPNIRNSENKTPLDIADPVVVPVLTGEYRKDELLEASRTGAEDRLLSLLTPLNVNCKYFCD